MSKQSEAMRIADERVLYAINAKNAAEFEEVDKPLRRLLHAELRRLHAINAELLEALQSLLEAADSMSGTFGCILGETPEHEDTHTHDKWAEDFLKERAAEARAAIAKAGEQP